MGLPALPLLTSTIGAASGLSFNKCSTVSAFECSFPFSFRYSTHPHWLQTLSKMSQVNAGSLLCTLHSYLPVMLSINARTILAITIIMLFSWYYVGGFFNSLDVAYVSWLFIRWAPLYSRPYLAEERYFNPPISVTFFLPLHIIFETGFVMLLFLSTPPFYMLDSRVSHFPIKERYLW